MKTIQFYSHSGALIGTGLVEGEPPAVKATDGHVYERRDDGTYVRGNPPLVHITIHVAVD